MKRFVTGLAITFMAAGFISCNDSSEETITTTDSATITGYGSDSANMSTQANTTPLAGEDSSFVLEAAVGGMVEVELGNVAQQNATNDRVKAYGQMMVTDHSQANNELKSILSGRAAIPDSIPADKRKHSDEMKKITGKTFDKHYVQMMVDDHKKTVSQFEQASKNLKDPQIKQWADKTLPVLKKHLDSIQAISKSKL